MKPVSTQHSGACHQHGHLRISAIPTALADVHHAIVSCERCPRLRDYCRRVAREKKRAYQRRDLLGPAGPRLRRPDGAPADRRPRARGARRQPDRPRLHRRRRRRLRRLPDVGAAPHRLRQHRHVAASSTTGSMLDDAYILAAVRCAPPDNKPLPEEITRCLSSSRRGAGAAAARARRRGARQDRLRRLAAGAEAARDRHCRRSRGSATARWCDSAARRRCLVGGAITRAARTPIPAC